MIFVARRLALKDLPEVMEEEREAWIFPDGHDLTASEETVRERMQRYPPGNIGVFEGKSLAGKCVWQPVREIAGDWDGNVCKENCSTKGTECYVINFDVRPKYRGTGASDALMDAALKSMKDAGMKVMWLGGRNVESNRRFYSRWLDKVEEIDNYWPEDKEAKGSGVMYKRDLTKPIEKYRVS